MKTMNTIKIFAILMIATNIALAGGNSNPDSNSVVRGTYTIPDYVPAIDKSSGGLPINSEVAGNHNTDRSVIPSGSGAGFNYLRFDVTTYYDGVEDELFEMPTPEYDYLRFNVTEYMIQNPAKMDEMPVKEFDYLKFDVKKFIAPDSTGEVSIGELPDPE
jgi:hypothetical protein